MTRSTLTFFALAGLLFLLVLWYGMRPTTTTPPNTIPAAEVAFSELVKGDQSEVTRRENYLITSHAEMQALWELLGTSRPMPTIDFDKNQVIAVFAGERPSAGHVITVTKVADSALRMVAIQIATPGPSCSAAQVVTTPYQVLLLPKTTLTLTHQDTATTTSCWQ